MPLTGLNDASLKLIFFGGKGGVGKTTCAVSSGLYLSKKFNTLVLSTDPAHSLSDSLGQQIGDIIVNVRNVRNLSAIEICANRSFNAFKTRYEREIKKIIDTSTYLDTEDTESICALSIPGIDEVMGLKSIIDLVEEKRFDKLVVDMAPTGHALRLLMLPEVLDEWIKVVAKMRWKYHHIAATFSGRETRDEGDDFLLEMKKTVVKIRDLFRDDKRCEFIIVTIPEHMAVVETERLLKDLSKHEVRIKQMVINSVLPHNDGCEFCTERRREQQRYIDYMRNQMGKIRMTVTPELAGEVRGLRELENFSELLFQYNDEDRDVVDRFESKGVA